MISLRSVSKRFSSSRSAPDSGNFAVRDLSLEVGQGETVALVGPSGCGKTTTLKMINRLIEPSSGEILVGGVNVASQNPVQLRRSIGYVIQSVGLMPHHTVARNIATLPRLAAWDKDRISRRVRELAELVQLDPELLDRYPSELSGGQRQRAGVARALGVDPPVMLMDEPFGAVDPIVRAHLQDEFLKIKSRLKKSVVFVTHDIDEAIKLSDRIAILGQQASLQQYAPPEEILRSPRNEFVSEFIGPERGLKRLALITVGSLQPDRGPVVAPSDTVERARQVMQENKLDWVAVVQGDVLLGWAGNDDLDNCSVVRDATPRAFSAHLSLHDSLRQAIDAIVTSRTNVAVVTDNERYYGLLTIEAVSKKIDS